MKSLCKCPRFHPSDQTENYVDDKSARCLRVDVATSSCSMHNAAQNVLKFHPSIFSACFSKTLNKINQNNIIILLFPSFVVQSCGRSQKIGQTKLVLPKPFSLTKFDVELWNLENDVHFWVYCWMIKLARSCQTPSQNPLVLNLDSFPFIFIMCKHILGGVYTSPAVFPSMYDLIHLKNPKDISNILNPRLKCI